MRTGRPLRFLAIALGGWTASRAVLLWPIEDPGAAIARMIQPPATIMLARVPSVGRSTSAPAPPRARRSAQAATVRHIEVPAVADHASGASPDAAAPGTDARIVAPFVPIQQQPSPRRFAVGAWMIARQGHGGPSAGGQLGGSQLGMRGTFMLDRARRIALSARLSAPLAGIGREAAIGVDWQPLRLPLHLIAERRIALDAGQGGTALIALGGIGPRPLAPGVKIEAYGQAGAILRDGIELLAEGAGRVSYDLGSLGGVRVDAGAGAWGGAQRGVARLDLGPSLGAKLPIAARPVRLTLDWRHHVAGSASPGSGPALSIGSDF